MQDVDRHQRHDHMVTELPTSLMLSPVQNSRKFRSLKSPPRRPLIARGYR